MCCIFTCCGWMIDLVQRLWTFTMSCCISSAVCCLMVTGSMSGIALGYNYSLAEYIDLKETNVSVYLKRGVFDDEIADDMDWRRSGRMPVAGHIGTDNLITGAPAEDERTPVQSGRRLDDSVFESDDPNKYEGSLMRLTAQPLYPGTTTGTTDGPEYVQSGSNFSPGSLDQLKAIQGMISARKSAMGNANTQQKTTYPDIDERYLAQLPPNPNLPPSGRRMMQAPNMADRLNPARFAVPPQSIGSKENWIYPKDPVKYRQKFSYSDIDYPDFKPHYPKPTRIPTTPIRLPKPTHTPEMRTYRPENEEVTKPKTPLISIKPDIDSAFKSFKEKMMLEKFEAPVHDYPKRPKDSSEDYDEDVKGLPVRRKRSIDSNKSENNTKISKNTDTTNDFKITNSDSTLTSSKITDDTEILNGNINYEGASEEEEYSTIPYEDFQIILKRDTTERLVNDKIEMTATANLLPYKLVLKRASKDDSKDLKSAEDHTENIADFGKNILNNIWSKLSAIEDEKFYVNSKSEDISKAVKRLSTIGISVSDIKPSTMVRILQYTDA